MDIMTKEESYADRRQLFKNIWETAMQIDDKDVDTVMVKPKVIKTLRLDEVDRCQIGKRKKDKIKNLRTVCNKILDFCDRQDANDTNYEEKCEDKEIADDETLPKHKLDVTHKKIKTQHRRKKVKRVKSFYVPKKCSEQQATSDKKEDYPIIFTNSPRHNSPVKTTVNFVQMPSVTQRRALKVKSNPDTEGSNVPTKGSPTRRKVLRKRRIKRRKKTAVPNLTPPAPSGASNHLRYFSPPIIGKVIVKRIKQFLRDNKIAVTSQV